VVLYERRQGMICSIVSAEQPDSKALRLVLRTRPRHQLLQSQEKQKVYCKRESGLGSRLGGQKICGTPEELRVNVHPHALLTA